MDDMRVLEWPRPGWPRPPWPQPQPQPVPPWGEACGHGAAAAPNGANGQ